MLFCYLSAAGFTGMPAAALPLDYLYHIVAKDQIELLMNRHFHRHVCEKCLQSRHSSSLKLNLYVY